MPEQNNPPNVAQRIDRFLQYARQCKGDEKGEAQVFCDRLFQAFGHAGYKEAGATLEERIRIGGQRICFADLVWKPRVLIEMKRSGENLQRHYSQAFAYWLEAVPNRPKYLVLCNFEEFWIYDFNSQLHEPVDKIRIGDLPQRFTALNFLFPKDKRPLFQNNHVAVTRLAADKVAQAFNQMVKRGVERPKAQRFILQSVLAMFADDFSLLPPGLYSELLDDCRKGASTYDLIGGLFRQMNTRNRADGGRYKGVQYFNGGLFAEIEPIDLNADEVSMLAEAAAEDWSKVQPPIFGTLFQSSLDKTERHALGAHYTAEVDIQKAVWPTIVRPWRERITKADTFA